MHIVVVNLNIGNLGSIPNMLKRLGCEAIVSHRPEDIAAAEMLILPGVGAFDTAMRRLHDAHLIPVLEAKVFHEKTPLLGICLGMQILSHASEEGTLPGLGWIPGQVARFRFEGANRALRVPHMGWNTVSRDPEMPLLHGFDADPRFYFVHAYHWAFQPDTEAVQSAVSIYGYPFPAVIQQGNLMGVQFHPEKSHRFGLKLFENFLALHPKAAVPSIELPC